MLKHTPGPWFAMRTVAYWEVCPQNAGNAGIPWTVCDVCPSAGGLQEANARLIAAAPEMLELLEEIVTNASKNYQGSTEIDPQIISSARWVISKARGESHA